MITRFIVAAALAVPSAGVVLAVPATAEAAPVVTQGTAPHRTHGALTKREHKDVVRLAAARTTTVTFRGSCPTLKVSMGGGAGTRLATGGSPLTVSGQPGRGKVTIAKPKRLRTCTSRWTATTAAATVTQAAYRRRPTPSPTATTPAPTPTSTATPTPTPTSASPTPAPTTATPTPTTASTTPTTASPTPTTGVTGVTPEKFGAVGDGVADDTGAVQAAINSLGTGDTLTLPAGKVYRHTAVLKVAVPGVTINGTGTLLATAEATSAVHLAAANVTLDGPTLRMGTTTKRWVAFEQMKLRLGRFDGITVRNVVIEGSAAAGVYVGGATHFSLTNVTVKNTRADAIHMTGGAAYGTLTNPRVVNPGDDGVAVVSYLNDGAQVHDITVESPRVEGQKWGRGLSVVGGYNVTYRNAYVFKSAGAGIYIAAENEFGTYGVDNVTVSGAQLIGCNQQADVDAADRPSPESGRVVHGAVMVYNSRSAATVSNVTMQNLVIKDTHPDGYDQVKLNNTSTGSISRQAFTGVNITGGSKYLFKAMGTPTSAYRLSGWTKEGVAVANQLGW